MRRVWCHVLPPPPPSPPTLALHHGASLPATTRRAFVATQPRTHFLDCGHPFFTHHGTQLDTTLLPDGMHFSAKGLEQALGPCLKPVVDALMRR